MAYSVDATIATGPSASGTSDTQAITTSAGATHLYLGTFNNNNISTMTATHAGNPMTLVSSTTDGTIYTYLFEIANPTSGTNNLVVSTNGGATNIWMIAASFFGTAAGAAEANSATNGNSGTNTNTLTTVSDNSLHIAVMVNQNGNAFTTGAGTQLVKAGSGTGQGLYASSPFAVTPAGSNTLTVTMTSSLWTNAGGSFAPSAAVTARRDARNLPLLGVG